MASRLNLHEEFCDILANRNAYFNPPESLKMDFPGIRYSLSGKNINRANDKNYKSINKYQVILIDYDPESIYVDKIMNRFQMCSFDRWYTSNNLNHFVFTIYY